MVTMETTTKAFYDWGRWVAGCRHCTSAVALKPGQKSFTCLASPNGCGQVTHVEWPDDPDGIARVLAGLPEPERHWDWPADE